VLEEVGDDVGRAVDVEVALHERQRRVGLRGVGLALFERVQGVGVGEAGGAGFPSVGRF